MIGTGIGNVTATFDTQGNTMSIPGVISSAGAYTTYSFTKVGTGTLILAGSNTFNSNYNAGGNYGPTIQAGTLQLGNNNALGNPANPINLTGERSTWPALVRPSPRSSTSLPVQR